MATFRYTGEMGLGHTARVNDPDLNDNLAPEMHELDMQPGTVVKIEGHDLDRDLLLVSWTDGQGTPRLTSIEDAVFEEMFTEVSE